MDNGLHLLLFRLLSPQVYFLQSDENVCAFGHGNKKGGTFIPPFLLAGSPRKGSETIYFKDKLTQGWELVVISA